MSQENKDIQNGSQSDIGKNTQNELHYEEKNAVSVSGMLVLSVNVVISILCIVILILSAKGEEQTVIQGFLYDTYMPQSTMSYIVGGLFWPSIIYLCLICPLLIIGLKVLGPNEALVLTFFGKYYGTLKGPGFYYVNPFTVSVNPVVEQSAQAGAKAQKKTGEMGSLSMDFSSSKQKSKKISLKAMTLDNENQKINDLLGNPIIIGIVVIWRVTNTAKAVFNVDNYKEFLSVQCDSALRSIVRLYPYDADAENNEKSLRGSSDEISQRLKDAIQDKVSIAGLEITEARITHLSYAQEIAAAMLQRQQATAIVDARNMIVDGAVGMVEMALTKLSEREVVVLDEERKAAMVSNLLVVLCGNKDTQPIVNSGSLY